MNNIRSICIAISLFIHTSVIGLLGAEGWLQRWIPVIPQPKTTEVSLQFVDSPNEFPDVASLEKESRFISDKTVKAKDMEEEIKEVPDKTKSKEVSPGKQLAKLSQSLPKPLPVTAEPVEPKEAKKPEPLKESIGRTEQAKPLEPVEPEEPEEESSAIPTPPTEQSIQAMAGEDMVNLPEVSEDLFSSNEKDIPTFEAQYHKIGPYFKEIKGMIETYWLGYLIFKYPNTAPIESETTVSFNIMPSGNVEKVKVLEHSGDIIFRDFCVATVSNTAPYPPLPGDIEDLEEDGGLNIVFTFRYR